MGPPATTNPEQHSSCLTSVEAFIGDLDRMHSESPVPSVHPFWDEVIFTISNCPIGEPCIVTRRDVIVFLVGVLLLVVVVFLLCLLA